MYGIPTDIPGSAREASIYSCSKLAQSLRYTSRNSIRMIYQSINMIQEEYVDSQINDERIQSIF